MNGIGGLSDWRWIFLLEGLPIIPLGFMTLCCLANIPETVRWLTPCEKQILTNILREDIGLADGEPESNTRLSWRQIFYTFTDLRIYLYAVISIGNLGIIRCWTVYFPNFIKLMKWNSEYANLLTAPPYIMASICVLIVGYSSSRKKEHGYHLAVILFSSAVGFLFLGLVTEKYTALLYISISITCCGTFAAFPILLSWLTINVGGHTKRALAVGFVSGFGKLGGILAPWIYKIEENETLQSQESLRRGHIICSIISVITVMLTLFLRFMLNRENNRRERLSEAEREQETKIAEPCDWHPDVRYAL